MKKSILFLLLCFTICKSTMAQTVFAPPNSKWFTERIIDTEGGDNYSLFETIKDTLFEGHNCSKVIGKEFSTTAPPTILETQYIYTNEDTVFYYNFTFSKFLPLYIFNVKKGDTISYQVPYIWKAGAKTTFRILVDSVDTVTIDGAKLKRIWTDALDDFTLGKYVERLGAYDAKKIISPMLIHATPSSGGIRCYQDPIIDTNLHFKGWACDYLKSNEIDVKSKNNFLSFYPNPFSENVILNNSLEEGVRVTIYNSLGIRLIQSDFEKKSACIINLENLIAGYYLFKVTDKSNNLIKKSILIKN